MYLPLPYFIKKRQATSYCSPLLSTLAKKLPTLSKDALCLLRRIFGNNLLKLSPDSLGIMA